MFATFYEDLEPRNSLPKSLRWNYENFDPIEDRKLAITFKVRNCTHCSWPYFTAKCSRNPSKLVSVSSPIEPTWFLPLLYKIFFKIEFYEKFMGFQKKIFVSKWSTNDYGQDPSIGFHAYLLFLKFDFFTEFCLVMSNSIPNMSFLIQFELLVLLRFSMTKW